MNNIEKYKKVICLRNCDADVSLFAKQNKETCVLTRYYCSNKRNNRIRLIFRNQATLNFFNLLFEERLIREQRYLNDKISYYILKKND